MEKVSKIVEFAFRDITKKGYFDINKGNMPVRKVYNKEMSSIPSIMTEYINECGFGCCFVFSSYMMKILNNYGINNYMIGTIEDTGIRSSVMYEENGEFYIANPIEDIEYFTKHNIKPEDRENYYIRESADMVIDGITHNDSHYTLEEFEKKYGRIWLIGSMNKDNSNTLADAMLTSGNRVIMPQESANYNIKQLIKK